MVFLMIKKSAGRGRLGSFRSITSVRTVRTPLDLSAQPLGYSREVVEVRKIGIRPVA